MRAYAKCNNCGHSIYTKQVGHLLKLLGADEIYTCKECGHVLDCLQLTLCSRGLNQDCDECEYRFQCFANILPIEAT